MKKLITPFTALLFVSHFIIGQGHILAGIVAWRKTTNPVDGVKVSARGAASVFTNELGYFELRFPNVEPSTPVRLRFGKTDKFGTALEVVPSDLLNNLSLPNKPDDIKLQIVVAPPDNFEEDVNLVYKTLDENVDRRLVNDSAKIQQQIDLPTQSLEEVQKLKGELKTMKERYRRAKSKLEDMAIQIASINLDTASEVVKEAIANISKGENIEKALVTLFNENLEGAYDKALRQKRSAEAEIQRIITKLEMEAESRTSDSLFVEAASKYESICRIYEENNMDPKKLADQQRNVAKAWFDAGEYENAAKFHNKSIATKEVVLVDRNHPSLGPNFAEIAITYYHLKNYYGAIDAYQRCIDIISKNEGAAAVSLIFPYNGMALTHKAKLDTIEAEKWFNKVIDLIEKHPDVSLDSRLAAYTNMVNFYVEAGKTSKAQSVYKKIIILLESGGAGSSEKLGDHLLKIAHVQQVHHEYGEAIKSLNYAMDSFGKTLPAEHHKIGDAQRMIAAAMRGKALYLFSEKKYDEALAVFNEIVPGSDDDEVVNQRGVCHYLLGNYVEALADYKQSAEMNPIRKETDYFSQCGMAYLKQNEGKKAKDAFEDFEKKDPSSPLVYRNWASYFAFVKKDKEDALGALQKAVKMGFHDLDWLRSESTLDNIRAETGFQQLLKEVEQLQQEKK